MREKLCTFRWDSLELSMCHLVKFCQKLHENEENWVGGTRPKLYYVDAPLVSEGFFERMQVDVERKVCT